MKLATVRTAGGPRAARVDGDTATLLAFPDVGALLANPGWREAAAGAGESVPLAGADLAPVVPRPPKIICVGLNYRSHILEMGRELPSHPTLFGKYAGALVGPYDDVVLPRASAEVDWEAELGVIIGAPVRHATPERAREAIAGYTVVNDVSCRDWQWRTTQWLQGKTFEATTPAGPVLVTGDEVGDAADLEVTCRVDGELMQQARTSDLLFDPAAVVAYVSEILTLEPGDLIATGTTGGVGAARDPKVFLKAGQQLRTEIEGVGACVNTCVPEPG